MITVLLIDDPLIIRVDFQHILEQNGDISVIAQACDAETGYGTFVSHAPDVCVTDISMPGAAGLEFMRKILVCNYQAKVLIFSMHDSETQREFEIFCLLAEGRSLIDCSHVLSISLKTVGNNQTKIKEKLDVSTLAALVHMAVRNGVKINHETLSSEQSSIFEL